MEQFPAEAEGVKNGIWRPRIFAPFSDRVAYGGTTNALKQDLGLDPRGVDYKLLAKPDRLKAPLKDKLKPGRFIVEALRRIAPDEDPHKIVKTQLVHGSRVVCVDEALAAKTLEERINATLKTDGLITDIPGEVLYVTAADCTPVAAYDRGHNAIGLFHSGWRGTAAQISVEGLKRMAEEFGSRPEEIFISIGPTVAAADYEVDDVVRNAFAAIFTPEELAVFFQPAAELGKYKLDVPLAIKSQLIKAGVPERQIEISSLTTSGNNDIFPSARRAGGIDKTDNAVYLMAIRS